MKRKLLISLGAISAFTPIIAVVACGKIAEPSSTDLDAYKKLTSSENLKLLELKWNEDVIAKQYQDKMFDSNSFLINDMIRNENVSKDAATLEVKLSKLVSITSITSDKRTLASTDYVADVTNGKVTINNVLKDEKLIINYRAESILHKLDVKAKADLKSAAWFVLRNEFYKDKKFLESFAKQLVADGAKKDDGTVYLDTDLFGLGFKVYEYQEMKSTDISDEALNLMLNFIKSDFRSKVYKQLIAEKYLLTNKADYSKAYIWKSTHPDSQQEQEITDDNFVLIKEMLSQKLFAQWNLTVDKAASYNYIGKTLTSLADARGAFTVSSTSVANEAQWSQKQIKADEKDILNSTNYDNMIGWKGYSTQAALGNKKLSFDADKMRSMTAEDAWEGIIQENDWVQTGIEILGKKAETVNLTYIKGLMPIYSTATNKYVLPTWLSKEAAARELAYKNVASIYKTASEFFRTTIGTTEGTYLKLNSGTDSLKTILQDANFEFIKERTAE